MTELVTMMWAMLVVEGIHIGITLTMLIRKVW